MRANSERTGARGCGREILRTAALAAAALLLAASPVRALSWIVPGVANIPTLNGNRFSSALTVVNSAAADLKVTVTLGLIPGPGTPSVPDRGYIVSAGVPLALNNVLATVWSIEGTGALRISADGPVALFARVDYLNWSGLFFGETPPPTLGSALPVVEEASLLSPGQTGHSAWLAQSSNASGERTNVAVAFPDDGGGTATVTLYDEKGTILGSLPFDVAQPAFVQRSLASFGAAAASAARVAVAVTRGHACAYTGTVDNLTGDVTIFSVDPAPAGPTAAVSSGVAQTPGLFGAFWQTEAHLFNPSALPVSGMATLLGAPAASPEFVFVPPGQTIVIRNVLTSVFHLSGSAVGAVLWSADGPLVIQTRTGSTAGDFELGSFGAGQAAIPLEAFQTAHDAPSELADLARFGPTRTNLLIAAGLAGCTYRIEARDEFGGAIGTVRQSLNPLGWGEFALSSLFSLGPQVYRVQLRVSIESGSANVQTAVADVLTNDPVFFETFPRPVTRISTPALPPGTWGSADGMEGLKVDATKILVERHCRNGTFPQPLRLDAQGRFAVLGSYVVMAGPITPYTAILTGQSDGQTITVSVSALDGFRLDSPTTFFLGKPYNVGPEFCPIEY